MSEEFLYEAVNSEGSKLHGSLNAESIEAVRAQLLDKGLMVLSVHPANQKWRVLLQKTLTHRKVPLRDVILFSTQFRTLFNAGINLAELLRILQNQTENPRLREAVADISQQITEGQSLYSGFLRHQDIFPPLYCNMISAGEKTGALGGILDRITYILMHEDKVNKQIATALRYPKMVLVALVIAFFVLLNLVIPQFATIFKAAHLNLPLPTRIAIELNAFTSQYWWLVLGVTAGLIYLSVWWLKTPNGKFFKDSLYLKLPIIGPVVQKSILARFASIFSILQRSGITMLDSLDILMGTLNNAAITREFSSVKEKLTAGQGLSDPLRSIKYFSPLSINMIAVGESTGNMESMMDELAKHYDEEVEFAVEGMTEAIGPIMLLALGVVVLFFALAIFLPMWNMVEIARH